MVPDLRPLCAAVIRALSAVRLNTAAGLLAALLSGLWLVIGGPAQAESPAFPPLHGRVIDRGDLISDAREAELAATLAALERDTTNQVLVVTASDLQGLPIEDYSRRLAQAWRIGRAGHDNGVLLVVATRQRRVRIQAGRGLEPVLTDALSARIIESEVLPSFRQGYYERGVQRGVAAIDRQLRLAPAEAAARAAAAERPRARAPIGIGVVVVVIFILMILAMIGGVGGRGRRQAGRGAVAVVLWAGSGPPRSAGGGVGGGFSGGGASGGW
jgi:uncharacterized protein